MPTDSPAMTSRMPVNSRVNSTSVYTHSGMHNTAPIATASTATVGPSSRTAVSRRRSASVARVISL